MKKDIYVSVNGNGVIRAKKGMDLGKDDFTIDFYLKFNDDEEYNRIVIKGNMGEGTDSVMGREEQWFPDPDEGMFDPQEVFEDYLEHKKQEEKSWYEKEYDKLLKDMRYRYNIAKHAPTGVYISCPYCSKTHIKSTYNKIFCSNRRTSGKDNCKDNYWNFVRGLKC